jgi:subtilisin family serine protease
MGEIGGTSNKIITVGAYVTKDSYVNIKGNTMKSDDPLNTLASFSSRGPTADGRTKPEITAPGEKIVSSVNSYDTSYNENNDEVIIRVEQGGSGWFFAAMQGTSMATPMTTGIVALMLQANPALGPEQAKQILKQNARTDSYTGTIPPEGSNSWGWGKIDAQKSVLAAFNAQGIGENRTPDLTVYPNPSTGIIHLKTTGSFRKFSSVSVMNLQGVTVYQSPENPGWKDQEAIDLSFLPSGVYMLNIQFSDGQPFHSKIAIVR